MHPDDERVMQLLEGALVRPAVDREAWLRLECPNEPELIQEVLDRAAWEDKLDGFLNEPILPVLPSREAAFVPGARVARRYRIVRELGRGRASAVYEAFDVETQTRVAIKIGGRTARPPRHPAFPRHFGIDQILTTEGHIAFNVMELLEGDTLAQVLRSADLSISVRRSIARTLCDGLAVLRASGMSPAALSANGVVLTSRGPVFTEDCRVAPEELAEAADLASFSIILRSLLKDDPFLQRLQSKNYPTLRELSRDLGFTDGSKRGGIGRTLSKLLRPSGR